MKSKVERSGGDSLYRWFLFRYNQLLQRGRTKRWYASATEIESRKQEEERVKQENVRLEERTRFAQLKITSTPDAGTEIELSIPNAIAFQVSTAPESESRFLEAVRDVTLGGAG